MICALLIGRKGSTGWPGKNMSPILGRPLSLYPIMALKNSKYIDKVYLSTDYNKLMKLAGENGVEIIERPEYLATKAALSEHAFLHGYNEIKKRIGEELEFFIPAFCNSPTIDTKLMDKAIEILREDSEKTIDSVVTVSLYNMYSALRAKKIVDDRVVPFIPLDNFDTANCDRDSQGNTYFIDNSVFLVRPKCMDFEYSYPPLKWLGRTIFPIVSWGGLDIDYEWQKGQAEFWLRKHGFSEDETPYDK